LVNALIVAYIEKGGTVELIHQTGSAENVRKCGEPPTINSVIRNIHVLSFIN